MQALAAEIVRLVAFGGLAVLLHAAARGRFELGPGHQGAAWIALLLVGRFTSGLRWAGTTTAVGAGCVTFAPLVRLGDPLVWVGYLVAGATVDLFYKMVPVGRGRLWVLLALGGVAHASKPVARAVSVGLTGWHYDSLLVGLPYPVASHFFFGAFGALMAAGLLRAHRGRKTLRTL